ncbi:MAG: nucleotidyltransferase family protein [Propionibacteriaceae bacterium]|nr:nucleotidyltransferase family protein [Micropruina sp.]
MTERDVPLSVRVEFAHAALQWLADAHGIDVLHIKGPALAPVLSEDLDDEGGVPSNRRASTDADVLVRPRQVEAFMKILSEHGWTAMASFESGSVFEHAAALEHTWFGHCDVHRNFPGIGLDPETAFDVLWADRSTVELAAWPCTVPSITAQRVVLLLHAGRTVGGQPQDVRRAWREASPTDQEQTQLLVTRLKAEIGLAAALGHLDDYADSPEADLWRLASQPETLRLAEWQARIKASKSPREALRLAFKALFVNVDHLTMKLGHPPTRRDMAAAYARRFATALRELPRLVGRRR